MPEERTPSLDSSSVATASNQHTVASLLESVEGCQLVVQKCQNILCFWEGNFEPLSLTVKIIVVGALATGLSIRAYCTYSCKHRCMKYKYILKFYTFTAGHRPHAQWQSTECTPAPLLSFNPRSSSLFIFWFSF